MQSQGFPPSLRPDDISVSWNSFVRFVVDVIDDYYYDRQTDRQSIQVLHKRKKKKIQSQGFEPTSGALFRRAICHAIIEMEPNWCPDGGGGKGSFQLAHCHRL